MKIGSFCSGILGLDLALDGELVFTADNAPGPSQVIAERTNAPNLGDWTTVDEFPEVDVVTDILGRTAALKALGNAVVPQQAALAWNTL